MEVPARDDARKRSPRCRYLPECERKALYVLGTGGDASMRRCEVHAIKDIDKRRPVLQLIRSGV